MREISETSKSYLGMLQHLVRLCNFFSVQSYFLDGTCFSELWGSCLFSDFFLDSQAPTTSITNVVFLPYLCSQETVSNLSSNGHCWWNLPGPDRQTSISNHKPWSPTARRKPEESIPTIWRPKGQTFTSVPLTGTHFQFMSNLFLKKHFVLFSWVRWKDAQIFS